MSPEPAPIASTRHTFILGAIVLLVAAAGWLALHSANAIQTVPTKSGPGVYLGLIAAELGLLYYVWVGVRRSGAGFYDLVSSRPGVARMLVDVAIGLLLLAVLYGVGRILTDVFGTGDVRLVRPLVAAAASQPVLWIALSIAAGVCEELVFRGYFQQQFPAWWRSPAAAIAAQSVLFGISHGYQGGILILKIIILSLILGVVAWIRSSRAPGIVAHIGLDIIGGLAGGR